MIRKLFLISLIWAILILILCGIPGDSLPRGPMFDIPNLDKFVHTAIFLPLALFLCAGFDLSGKQLLRTAGPFITMLIIAFYGGLIEILQEKIFINRSSEFLDFLSDLIGGLTGLCVYYFVFRKFFRRLPVRKS